MIYFQGMWYCTQCGWDYEMKPKNGHCHYCDGVQFEDFPSVPKSDTDQLTEQELQDEQLSMGIF